MVTIYILYISECSYFLISVLSLHWLCPTLGIIYMRKRRYSDKREFSLILADSYLLISHRSHAVKSIVYLVYALWYVQSIAALGALSHGIAFQCYVLTNGNRDPH